MKQVSEMPTSGQFVAVWSVQNGKIWSDTIVHRDGMLFSYVDDKNIDTDDLFINEVFADFYIANNAQYFIAD